MEFQYKKHTILIEQDIDPMNPREEFCCLGEMICFHKRYNLGDKHNLNSDNFNGWDELEEYIENELNGYIILPVYMYDHSGMTINTTGFSCGWDSGQIGFIYVTAKKIRENYGVKRISAKLKQDITGYLKNEIQTYDQFLTGDVWSYSITDNNSDNIIDTCYGFFGQEYCENEAKSAVDWIVKDNLLKRINQVKTWIKNRVPLENRIFAI